MKLIIIVFVSVCACCYGAMRFSDVIKSDVKRIIVPFSVYDRNDVWNLKNDRFDSSYQTETYCIAKAENYMDSQTVHLFDPSGMKWVMKSRAWVDSARKYNHICDSILKDNKIYHLMGTPKP